MFALGKNHPLWAMGFKPASFKTIVKRLQVRNQKLNMKRLRVCPRARRRGGRAGSRFGDTNVEVPSTRCKSESVACLLNLTARA